MEFIITSRAASTNKIETSTAPEKKAPTKLDDTKPVITTESEDKREVGKVDINFDLSAIENTVKDTKTFTEARAEAKAEQQKFLKEMTLKQQAKTLHSYNDWAQVALDSNISKSELQDCIKSMKVAAYQNKAKDNNVQKEVKVAQELLDKLLAKLEDVDKKDNDAKIKAEAKAKAEAEKKAKAEAEAKAKAEAEKKAKAEAEAKAKAEAEKKAKAEAEAKAKAEAEKKAKAEAEAKAKAEAEKKAKAEAEAKEGTPIDVSVTVDGGVDKDIKAFETEISSLETDKQNAFSKPEVAELKETGIKLNYTRNTETNQNKVSVEADYVNKEKQFKASAELEIRQSDNSEHHDNATSIGLKGEAIKEFDILGGKAEVDARTVVEHTDGQDVNETTLNGKVGIGYQREIAKVDDVTIKAGAKTTVEGTAVNGSANDGKVTFDTSINFEQQRSLFTTFGATINTGVFNQLVSNDKVDSGIGGKLGLDMYWRAQLMENLKLQTSFNSYLAGNSSYMNSGYGLGLDLVTPLSLHKENNLKLGVNYNVDNKDLLNGKTTQKTVSTKALFELENGKDVYAKYNYDVSNNKHSATIGAKIRLK